MAARSSATWQHSVAHLLSLLLNDSLIIAVSTLLALTMLLQTCCLVVMCRDSWPPIRMPALCPPRHRRCLPSGGRPCPRLPVRLFSCQHAHFLLCRRAL